jgi:hypothetical protein
MVAAWAAQERRVAGAKDDHWANCAQVFKADPRRELEPVLAKVASYVEPDDVLLDVGGGAGRMGLPLALRCREVINVDPSAGMAEVFHAVAKEAGITSVRFVASDWLDAQNIEGDVALVAHVTYFVPEIAPFIEKLNAATRRRVIVSARTIPPPNQIAPFFKLAHDEDLARVPGPDELRAVLDEMNISPEYIDVGPAMLPATAPAGKTREDAIRIEVESGLRGGWIKESTRGHFAGLIDQRFDDLLVETPEGFRRRNAIDARDVLIMWETR